MPIPTLTQRLAIAREVTRTVLDGPAHRGPFTAGHQTLAAISAVCIGDVDEADARKVLDAAMRRALGAAKLGLSESKPDPIAVSMLMGECIGEVLCEREDARRLIDAVRHSGREEAPAEAPATDAQPSEAVFVGGDEAELGAERSVVHTGGAVLSGDDLLALLVEEVGGGQAEPTPKPSHRVADPDGVTEDPTDEVSHEAVGVILALVAPVVEEVPPEQAAPPPTIEPPTAAPAIEPAPAAVQPPPPAERSARPARRAPK